MNILLQYDDEPFSGFLPETRDRPVESKPYSCKKFGRKCVFIMQKQCLIKHWRLRLECTNGEIENRVLCAAA